jgi:hypothetical protein
MAGGRYAAPNPKGPISDRSFWIAILNKESDYDTCISTRDENGLYNSLSVAGAVDTCSVWAAIITRACGQATLSKDEMVLLYYTVLQRGVKVP